MAASFIDVTKLDLIKPDLASAGALLVKPRHGKQSPLLMVRDPRFAHGLSMDFGTFVLNGTPTNIDSWLSPKAWRIVVDPASSMSPERGMPVKGEAFIADGLPGIVGWDSSRVGHGEAYIGIDGSLLDEPNWTKYVGFKKWQIVSDDFEGEAPTVIFERSLAAVEG